MHQTNKRSKWILGTQENCTREDHDHAPKLMAIFDQPLRVVMMAGSTQRECDTWALMLGSEPLEVVELQGADPEQAFKHLFDKLLESTHT
jgi:hypothetical protein